MLTIQWQPKTGKGELATLALHRPGKRLFTPLTTLLHNRCTLLTTGGGAYATEVLKGLTKAFHNSKGHDIVKKWVGSRESAALGPFSWLKMNQSLIKALYCALSVLRGTAGGYTSKEKEAADIELSKLLQEELSKG